MRKPRKDKMLDKNGEWTDAANRAQHDDERSRVAAEHKKPATPDMRVWSALRSTLSQSHNLAGDAWSLASDREVYSFAPAVIDRIEAAQKALEEAAAELEQHWPT